MKDDSVMGLRDRAMLELMVHSFAPFAAKKLWRYSEPSWTSLIVTTRRSRCLFCRDAHATEFHAKLQVEICIPCQTHEVGD